MNVSYFCRHCGKHIRQGDHRRCREILIPLDEIRRAEEAKRKKELEGGYLHFPRRRVTLRE